MWTDKRNNMAFGSWDFKKETYLSDCHCYNKDIEIEGYRQLDFFISPAKTHVELGAHICAFLLESLFSVLCDFVTSVICAKVMAKCKCQSV